MTIIDDARDWQQAISDRDTANLQHQNDQQTIADLQGKYDADELALTAAQKEVANADAAVAEARALVQAATAQLASLQSVKVYDGLEFAVWKQTFSAASKVGGSGRGTVGQRLPAAGGMARLWVTPDAPLAGQTDNFFDCYNTQDFALDDTLRRFKMEAMILFESQLDANAANCLELEARHIFADGTQHVFGVQTNWGKNIFNYWDHGQAADGSQKGWKPSGQPMPRWIAGKWHHLAVAGHHDGATVYHDYIQLDDLKVDLTGKSYPAYIDTVPWDPRVRCAIQLDAQTKAFGIDYTAKFTVSQ